MRSVLGAVSCLSVVLLTACGAPRPEGVHELVADPTSIDFGTLDVGAMQTRSISLRNPGTAAVLVSGVRLTGSTAFQLREVQLSSVKGGESLEVSVTYAPRAPGADSSSLAIDTDSLSVPSLSVSIVGRAVDCSECDGGRVDAGRVDAGLTDAGTPDAGRIDAGLPDAGQRDAGPFDAGVEEDAGCVGSWRVVPSEAEVNVYVNGGLVEATDASIFYFEQSDSTGRTLPPFSVEGLQGALTTTALPTKPSQVGDCRDLVVGHELLRRCWGSLARFDLITRTWTTGRVPPTDVPEPRSSLTVATDDGELITWGDNPVAHTGYRYTPSTDQWERVADAGSTFPRQRYALTQGGTLALVQSSGVVSVLRGDAGTWGSFRMTSDDGGAVEVRGSTRIGDRLFAFGPPSSTQVWRAWELDLQQSTATLLPIAGVPFTPRELVKTLPAGNEALLIPEQSGTQLPASDAFRFVASTGEFQRLAGERIDLRTMVTYASTGDAVYARGGAPWHLGSDGGVQRGLMFRWTPGTPGFVALDAKPLGAPVIAFGAPLPPALLASPQRGRAVLLGRPGVMLDPVSLQWEPLPRWPSAFEASFNLANQGTVDGTGAISMTGGSSSAPGATLDVQNQWTVWTGDAGMPVVPSGSRSPVTVGGQRFVWSDGPWLYQPGSSTWSTPTSGAPAAREAYFTVAPLDADRAWVWGGLNQGVDQANGGVFSSQTGWSSIDTTGATPGIRNVATWWNGTELFVIGGLGAGGNRNTQFHAYDPATNRWRRLTNPGFDATALVGVGSGVVAMSSETELGLYRPGSNTWRCIAPPPRLGANEVVLAELNGRVVVVGRADRVIFSAAVLEGL